MEDNSQLAPDFANMSDEELSNFDLSQLNVDSQPESEPEENPEDLDNQANEDDADPQAPIDENPASLDDDEDTDLEPTATQEDEQPADDQTPEKDPEPVPSEPVTQSEDGPDYKAFYERVTAKFKANGRDMSFSDPDEIIAMMQRGAGFAKKMTTLKPSMRLVRTLENHKIDEARLSFLLDLHNKNPDAINKLIKESGVDVYSLDAEKADTYKAKATVATDSEVELSSVIEDLQASSPTFQRTLDTVVNQWDTASQQTIAQHPMLLRLIDGHVQQGYFDVVMDEVERLRVVGGLIDGLSDFDAYRKVGDDLNAKGVFSQPKTAEPTQAIKPEPAPVLAPPPAAKQAQTKESLQAQRRAASTPRPAAKPAAQEVDYSKMSDDELLDFLSTRR